MRIYVINHLGDLTAIIQNINTFKLSSGYICIDDISTGLSSSKVTELLARITTHEKSNKDMWIPEFNFKSEKTKMLVDMWDSDLSWDEVLLKLELNK